MARNCKCTVWVMCGGIVLAAASAAQAGIGQRIYRGLTYGLANNLGTVENGPLANQNIFRQRVIRNIPGDGVGYEATRVWGTDSFGNGTQYDAGPFNVSLQGTTHGRATVNRRFIPELNLQFDTAGAPLNYDFDVFDGIQNFNLNGAFNGNLTGTINALGFYRLQVNGQNTGTRTADGFVLTDNQSTNFDLGPINVSGNIFLDIAAGVFQAVANTPGALQFAIPSAASGAARVKPEDSLATALTLPASDATASAQQEMASALVRAIFQQSWLELSSGEQSSLEQLALGLTQSDLAAAEARSAVVPEPATLVLLAAPAVLLVLRRKH